MLGRGIDQILPFPSEPTIYESYIKDATRYVRLAEEVNGPIPKPVDFAYVWGDALGELARVSPDVRLINLETSITLSNDYWRGKGINYRMNPKNIPCLVAAGIDCCSLANNHTLDWGYSGLIETLETLRRVGVKTAGAGRNLGEAEDPAKMTVADNARVTVFSFGSPDSGIPWSWQAEPDKSGVNLLKDLNSGSLRRIEMLVSTVKQKGDIVVFSVHWGGNWGYEIPAEQTQFAHRLIDDAGIDIVWGHSSHHPKAIEIYEDKLILYGCGDFLNDYEGIGGYENFRPDLSLMYFPGFDPVSKLVSLQVTPMQVKSFRLNRANRADATWLTDTLNREGTRFGSRLELREDNSMALREFD